MLTESISGTILVLVFRSRRLYLSLVMSLVCINTFDSWMVLDHEVAMGAGAPGVNAMLAVEKNIQPCSKPEALLGNLFFNLRWAAKT